MGYKQKRMRDITVRIILSVIAVALLGRSLPYFAPIYAKDIAQKDVAFEFSDRHNLPLGTILTQDREHTAIVPLNQVSPTFIKAIIAAEDGQYYHHGALDLKAIFRSIKDSIQAKKVTSGASTITMQLSRMLEPVPRNLQGKLQEIWLSWRIVAGMNKDEILSAYINRLPMGGNLYGVEAAARIYFNLPSSDLNLAQSTLLAALPNNPTYFSPYDHWNRLKQRQSYVLNRMVQEGYINLEQAKQAKLESVTFQPRQQGIIAAPHFLFWLSHQIDNNQIPKIKTTIDRSLQQFVEAQVKQVIRTLSPNNVHHGAALVIDNHTGEVLAYVGSPDYFDNAEGRNDGVQALRQPGSTLKPFLYELGLENRIIHPNSVLADVPTHYAIPGAKLYSPADYNETFLGPVRVRVALANSLNVPAVRVLERVGVQNFLNRLHQLGFKHLNHPPEYYGLGLTLGSGEVSLWELANAYVTLAKQGEIIPLKTTFSQSTSPNFPSPISNSTWALVTDMLSDRYARSRAFGVDSLLALPFPSAVKTGTSSDYRDTWTVGFTTDYTVAAWVGNFNGDRMRQVSGVTGAAPLWNRIMLYLHSEKEPTPFSPPQGMIQRPICALSGLRPTAACPSVVQEYFFPEDLGDYETHPDTFYQTVATGDNVLNLPPEYDEWLEKQRSPLISKTLKILSPQNGDIFLTQPGAKLEFLATASTQPVQWLLNGQPLPTQSNSLFWNLRPGNWTLQLKSGDLTDQVSFQVQSPQSHTTRRGFSVSRE